jgi:hypothetical protein
MPDLTNNWNQGYFKGLLRESDGTASFARTGSLILLLAVLGWISYVILHTHSIPALADVKEFLTGSFLCLYGVNKTANVASSFAALFGNKTAPPTP